MVTTSDASTLTRSSLGPGLRIQSR
jgi:hypothetical protein